MLNNLKLNYLAVKRCNLSSVSLTQSATRSLIEKGILRKTDKGLSIYDFLFNAWIKKHYV